MKIDFSVLLGGFAANECSAGPFLVEIKEIQLRELNILASRKEFEKVINIKVRSTGRLLKAKINFVNNSLTVEFREPFKPRRGRINCSLNDNGKWRWFGVQFPIKKY